MSAGRDPCDIHYDESGMREHLAKCLKEKHLERFPILTKRIRSKCSSRLMFIDVYCVCRDIFIESEVETKTGRFMAMYSVCDEWYHRECLNIPVKYLACMQSVLRLM